MLKSLWNTRAFTAIFLATLGLVVFSSFAIDQKQLERRLRDRRAKAATGFAWQQHKVLVVNDIGYNDNGASLGLLPATGDTAAYFDDRKSQGSNKFCYALPNKGSPTTEWTATNYITTHPISDYLGIMHFDMDWLPQGVTINEAYIVISPAATYTWDLADWFDPDTSPKGTYVGLSFMPWIEDAAWTNAAPTSGGAYTHRTTWNEPDVPNAATYAWYFATMTGYRDGAWEQGRWGIPSEPYTTPGVIVHSSGAIKIDVTKAVQFWADFKDYDDIDNGGFAFQTDVDTAWRVAIGSTAAEQPVLVIDYSDKPHTPPWGGIPVPFVFGTDDGNDIVYDSWGDLFLGYDATISLCLCKSGYGGLTDGEIQELISEGHIFVNHSPDHNYPAVADWPGYYWGIADFGYGVSDSINEAIDPDAQWIHDEFDDQYVAPKVYAYPNGGSSLWAQKRLSENGYLWSRCAGGWEEWGGNTNTMDMGMNNPNPPWPAPGWARYMSWYDPVNLFNVTITPIADMVGTLGSNPSQSDVENNIRKLTCTMFANGLSAIITYAHGPKGEVLSSGIDTDELTWSMNFFDASDMYGFLNYNEVGELYRASHVAAYPSTDFVGAWTAAESLYVVNGDATMLTLWWVPPDYTYTIPQFKDWPGELAKHTYLSSFFQAGLDGDKEGGTQPGDSTWAEMCEAHKDSMAQYDIMMLGDVCMDMLDGIDTDLKSRNPDIFITTHGTIHGIWDTGNSGVLAAQQGDKTPNEVIGEYVFNYMHPGGSEGNNFIALLDHANASMSSYADTAVSMWGTTAMYMINWGKISLKGDPVGGETTTPGKAFAQAWYQLYLDGEMEYSFDGMLLDFLEFPIGGGSGVGDVWFLYGARTGDTGYAGGPYYLDVDEDGVPWSSSSAELEQEREMWMTGLKDLAFWLRYYFGRDLVLIPNWFGSGEQDMVMDNGIKTQFFFDGYLEEHMPEVYSLEDYGKNAFLTDDVSWNGWDRLQDKADADETRAWPEKWFGGFSVIHNHWMINRPWTAIMSLLVNGGVAGGGRYWTLSTKPYWCADEMNDLHLLGYAKSPAVASATGMERVFSNGTVSISWNGPAANVYAFLANRSTNVDGPFEYLVDFNDDTPDIQSGGWGFAPEPTITNTVGTWTDGGTIQIVGVDFGLKDGDGPPELWETWEDDGATTGDSLHFHMDAGWLADYSEPVFDDPPTPDHDAHVSWYSDTTSVQRTGAGMNVCMALDNGENQLIYDLGHTDASKRINYGDKAFVSFFWTSNWHGSRSPELPQQWKMHGFVHWIGLGGPSSYPSFAPDPDNSANGNLSWRPGFYGIWQNGGVDGNPDYPGRLIWENYPVSIEGSIQGSELFFTRNTVAHPNPDAGEWVQYEVEIQAQSGFNIADGTARSWYNGWHDTPTMYRTGYNQISDPDVPRSFLFAGPRFGRHVAEYWQGGYNPYYTWIDDIYCDLGWARVCIGDSDDFDNCTVHEYQIPVAWTHKSIIITVNQGSLPSEETLYLYVIDYNGNRSDPYEISLQ